MKSRLVLLCELIALNKFPPQEKIQAERIVATESCLSLCPPRNFVF